MSRLNSIGSGLRTFFINRVQKSLKIKLTISSLIPVAFIIVLGIVSYSSTARSIKEKVTQSSLQTIMSMEEYFNLSTSVVELKTSEAISSADVRDYFSVDPNSIELDTRTKLIQSLTNFLNSKTINDKFISRFTIIGDYSFLTSGSGDLYQVYLKDIKGSGYYELLEKADGKAVWLGSLEELDEVSSQKKTESIGISCSRILKNIRTNKPYGIIVVNIKPEFIGSIIDNINLGQDSEFHIITPDLYDFSKEVISYEGDKKNISREFSSQDFFEDIQNSEESNGSINVMYKDKSYIAVYSKIPETGFILVGLIPEKSLLADVERIKWITLVVVLTASVIAILIGLKMSNGMSKTIRKITTATKSAASGDLTVEIKTKRIDELGVLSNNISLMINGMRKLIEKTASIASTVSESAVTVSFASNDVSVKANEIKDAIKEISEGTYDQAEEAEESVNKISRLAAKINNVSDCTNKIEALTENTMELTIKGVSSIGTLSRKASETTKITKDILLDIQSMDDQSKNIGKIVKVIRGLADQTNLLALNASIEAARAGESGRGFAVVADEVRKLAEQSMNAAEDISKIIKGIQNQTAAAADKALYTEEILTSQNDAVSNTMDSFKDISNSMENLEKQVKVILEEVNEMENYKEDSLKAILNISSVTEQTAASSQGVNSMSEEQYNSIEKMAEYVANLREASEHLSEAISIFKI
jgi:methyl-accepting chemotaxis protein